MQRFFGRFEDRLITRRLSGTLPYQIMTGVDMTWVGETAAAVTTVTAVKGYRSAAWPRWPRPGRRSTSPDPEDVASEPRLVTAP